MLERKIAEKNKGKEKKKCKTIENHYISKKTPAQKADGIEIGGL